MDTIQKTLVKLGRRDLAQEYYEKVGNVGLPSDFGRVISDLRRKFQGKVSVLKDGNMLTITLGMPSVSKGEMSVGITKEKHDEAIDSAKKLLPVVKKQIEQIIKRKKETVEDSDITIKGTIRGTLIAGQLFIVSDAFI